MAACLGAAAQERSAPAAPPLPPGMGAGAAAIDAARICGAPEIGRGRVAHVLDGRSLVLDDGRTIRLAGIEVPFVPSQQRSVGAPGGLAARSALAALLTGAQVVLKRADLALDRYGRVVAFVDLRREQSQLLAEAELISAGFARVGDDAGGHDCAAELLRREAAARRAKRGLWADPYYDPLPADNPAAILAHRGHFALIEGRVLSIHQSGAVWYVNFGLHWSQDFAATIRKKDAASLARAGFDVKHLSGRRVRVRGFIAAHGGPAVGGADDLWRAPWIEILHPEQIELIDRN